MGIQNDIQDHPWHVPVSLSLCKACHLPVEIEYKAWWAMRNLNMDMNRAGLKRMLEIDELEELRNDAYFNSKIAKDRQNKWHDQLITRKTFNKGAQVLLYDSKLHLFLTSSNRYGRAHLSSTMHT